MPPPSEQPPSEPPATAASPAARPVRSVRAASGRAAGLPPTFWRVAFPALVVFLGLMIPLLGWIGVQIVLNTTDGNLSTRQSDPSAPGYEAVVEPTPTLLALHMRDGAPVGAAVLTLTGEGAGGVIVMSADTVVERDGARVTIADAYEQGGIQDARTAAELALGVQVGDVVEVDDGRWADLLGPLGALEVENTDAVEVDGEVLFEPGTLVLAPADVGSYLGAGAGGTEEVNRLLRYEGFWRSWLTGVSERSAGAPPGEGEGGPGWFVTQVASGEWTVSQLPAEPLPLPGSDDVLFAPIRDQVDVLVAELIPFPVGAPPGSRLRVRLLDGTGELERGLPFAEAVVAGGGEVAVIGNASSFDVEVTQIQLSDAAQQPQAEELRDSLGVGEIVVGGAEAGGSDVTVVLGRDAVSVVGAEIGD